MCVCVCVCVCVRERERARARDITAEHTKQQTCSMVRKIEVRSRQWQRIRGGSTVGQPMHEAVPLTFSFVCVCVCVCVDMLC